MGWCGSDLAESSWKLVRDFIPEEKRGAIAKKFKDKFDDWDCDDWDGGSVLEKDSHKRRVGSPRAKYIPDVLQKMKVEVTVTDGSIFQGSIFDHPGAIISRGISGYLGTAVMWEAVVIDGGKWSFFYKDANKVLDWKDIRETGTHTTDHRLIKNLCDWSGGELLAHHGDRLI